MRGLLVRLMVLGSAALCVATIGTIDADTARAKTGHEFSCVSAGGALVTSPGLRSNQALTAMYQSTTKRGYIESGMLRMHSEMMERALDDSD